ncbi:metal ABC transporter solute-binding protein, Zn/Mn family [Geobacillus sp. C56-T2]|uniref:metal ABC transporter solute-binding protein, Zn/Mn family n=1 Tax=Geobacillus sp. C56-T2 TaxID=600773 RepID=UPI0011A0BE9D|nr:zinc ABC transporter substrate-binding protein [Geobacillus sp. C56-T2]NNV07346.1 adhesin [Geobacillus sp. MMMUD3]TWG31631.1 zinc transport system substrate-binding protein [Geobacillus sp. C56-T2]
MRTTSILLSLLLTLSALLYGCQSNPETNEAQPSKDRLTIYTTVYPLEDFAKKIGGDAVIVKSVYPPGAEAHTFEPTTKTVQQIAEADAFIYIGQGMEPFAEKLKETLQHEHVRFFVATEGIEWLEANDEHEHEHDEAHKDEQSENDQADHNHGHSEDNKADHNHGHSEDNKTDHGHGHSEDNETDHGHGHSEDNEADHGHGHSEDNEADHGHGHGDRDPHVWLDPIRSIVIAENIRDLLTELKPEKKEQFQKNFETVKTKLERLDAQFRSVIEKAPKKEILVSHQAYGYWEDRYGIKQLSVSGLSPSNEPSQKALAQLIETAKQHRIRYMIFEQNVHPKTAEVIQNELGAKPLRLHNLESLTAEDRKAGRDYFAIMEENIRTLQTALQ